MKSMLWLSFWFLSSLFVGLLPADSFQTLHLDRSLSLGADVFGRPLGFLILKGSFGSACVAGFSTVLSTATALLLAGWITFSPRLLQTLLLRSLETTLAFPTLLFALAWAAIRGPGWSTLLFALLLGSAPSLTRLVHVRSHEILQEDYVIASRGLGAGSFHVFFRHLLPAALRLCWVKAPNLFAQALIAEATLSFLGVGAPFGADTWGSLLLQGKDYLIEAPHITLLTGVPLVLTILSLQALSQKKSRRQAPAPGI